jgi:hypothetical protein
MRPWARWAARTALVTFGLAAATGGLSGIAVAGTGGEGNPGGLGLLGGTGPLAPVSTVCGDASALLGIAVAGCSGVGAGAAASAGKHRATSVGAPGGSISPGARTRGVSQDRPGASSASTALQGAVMPGELSGTASPALRQIFSDTLNAPGLGAGNTDNTAASGQVGLGGLPGLADLPSLSGPTNPSARSDAPGGSALMPISALNTADASGMSSDSFAALAIGALIAGAAALKIASRRARDRKAELEQRYEKRTLGFSRGRNRDARRRVRGAGQRGFGRWRRGWQRGSAVGPVR